MISIVVPIYNKVNFLPQCLDSLVNQTYRDIEIICVDDGSTDGTQHFLKQSAANDSRIKVVNQGHCGVSEARNKGIEEAKGEWLMFVDSDDWLELDCCERAMEKAGHNDLVFFSYIREFKRTSAPKHVIDEQQHEYGKNDIDRLFERLIAPGGEELRNPAKLDSLSTVWGKLYKTSIVREHQIQFSSTKKTGTLEDMVFNGKYFNYIERALYMPDCLYHQRKTTSASITYSYKPDLDKKWQYVFQEIEKCSTAVQRPWIPAALERRKALCLFGLGLNIMFSNESWYKKHQMLDSIIVSDWYTAAIAHLETSPMPVHWKGFYGMARHKQTWAVQLMLQAMNIIINR